MLFKKNKYEKKQIELLVNILKTKAQDFTVKDIKSAILAEGYNKKIADKVVKKMMNLNIYFKLPSTVAKTKRNDSNIKVDLNKDSLINKKSIVKNNDNNKQIKDRDAALKELFAAISMSKTKKELKSELDSNNKNKSEIKKDLKDLKSNKIKLKKKNAITKIPGKNFFSRVKVGLEKGYYFFEDKYYDVIDSIDKKVKITPIIDSIDKYFPSFILIILLSILVIFLGVSLIINTSSPSIFNLSVEVVDTSGNAIKNANIIIQYDDVNIEEGFSDVFGEYSFENVNAKGNINLIVSKEFYHSVERDIKISSKSLSEKIELDIDTDYYKTTGGAAQYRDLMFSSNNVLAGGKALDITLRCENSHVSPIPSSKRIVNGRLTVDQPAGCGNLRVDVKSTFYEPIINQIVPESNKVLLTEVENDQGQLEINVKGINNSTISEANIIIYGVDDPSTNVDESQYQIESGYTDYYGRYVFDLNPGTYNFTVDKYGYLLFERSSDYTIIKNNKISVEYTLIKFSDLENIDCSNEVLSRFCVNNKLDCNNELLQDYLLHNEDGSCQIGEFGYVDVILKDMNTNVPVKGDIAIWKKDNDSNSFSIIASRHDLNHTVFEVSKYNTYQLRVSNTEQFGYIAPEPLNVEFVDVNKTIFLEYSSTLNSGTITSKVTYNGNQIANASVYLYYGSGSFEDTLVTSIPQYTNSSGDVNFVNVRSGKNYYVNAISSALHAQGISNTNELDANEILELNANLTHQSKILRLSVNTTDYSISFYDALGDAITEFVVSDVGNNEKDYTFTCEETQLYAVLSAPQYATYQTELLTLVYGDTIYKEVDLDPNLPSSAYTYLEFDGLYDETGQIEVSEINFANGGLNKEYKLKFTYFSSTNSKDLAYAFIRAGNYLTINEDSIYLTDIFAPNADIDYGCKFSGEIEEWDDNSADYISSNLGSDHDTLYCSDTSNLEKWVQIDFTESADIVEFSVNFKFSEQLIPTSNYKFYYRSLVNIGPNFAFEPDLDDWQDWVVSVPECYFYAPGNDVDDIGFGNTDYSYNYILRDENNFIIDLENWNNILYIDDNYNYNLSFMYLNDNSIYDKSLVQNSENTLENLIYNNLIFNDSEDNNETYPDSFSTFSVDNIDANIGYTFNLNTDLKAQSFFSINDNPYIASNIFLLNNVNPLEILVYAYSKNNMVVNIETEDATLENKIFTGDNIISIDIYDSMGGLLNYDIEAYYTLPGGSEQLFGTLSNGSLENQIISVPQEYINQNIEFRFTSSNENWTNQGFYNQSIYIEKTIDNGFVVYHEDQNLPITFDNPLIYNLVNLFYNNNFEGQLESKLYRLMKYSSDPVTLEDIYFSGNQDVFDVVGINSALVYNNLLPKNIYDTQTNLYSYIKMNSSSTNGSETIPVVFNNILDIGNNSSIILDVNTEVNLFDINLTGSLINSNSGINIDNNGNIVVEFIKGINNNINMAYTVTNNSDVNLYLESSCINYNGTNIESNIDITGYNCGSGDIIGPSNTYNLDLNFELLDNAVTLNNTIYVELTFVNVSKGITFTYFLPINLKVMTASMAFNVSNINGNSVYIYCKDESDGCNATKVYTIENNTQTYNISFIGTSFDFNHMYFQSFNINDSNFDINSSQSKDVLLTLNGIYSANNIYYQDIVDLNFELSIVDSNYFINKDLDVTIIYKLKSAEDTLGDFGLTSNFCLGSGGVIKNNNLFILADCNSKIDNCETGPDKVPKIVFDWSSSPDWSNICIEEDNGQGLLQYNINKKHCDSTQMMLSLLDLAINESLTTTADNRYYIYLMYDGINDSFISDFSNYINSSFSSFFDLTQLNANSDIFNNQNRISINKIVIDYDGVSHDTKNPGKYEIVVNEDFILSNPSDLNITLKFVQEVPYSQRSLFYYLPIDGKVGYDSSSNKLDRNGYGVGSHYLNLEPNELVNLEYSPDNPLVDSKLYSVTNTDSSLVYVSVDNLNNIYTNDFSKLQKTNSKLININLDTITENNLFLNLVYSPSYIIPIYARAINMNDSNLSYNLYEGANSLSFNFNNLLYWYDYRAPNTRLKDISVLNETLQNYLYSEVTKGFLTPSNALLKTNLHIPNNGSFNISDFKLSLDTGYNDSNSLLYNFNNYNSGHVEISLDSRIDTQITSIKTIFDQISTGKACIYNGLANTYVKWVPEEYEFTDTEESTIISDFENNYVNNPNNNSE